MKPGRWEWHPDRVPHEWRDLVRHMIAFVPGWDGQGSASDLIQRTSLQQSGTPVWTSTDNGWRPHTDTATTEDWYWAGSDWVPSANVTIFIGKEKTDGTNRQHNAFGIENTSDATTRCQAHVPWSDGTVYFDFGGSSGNNRISVGSLSFGDDVWCFRAGDSGMEMWQNGTSRASSATGISRTTTASNEPFGFGGAHAGTSATPVRNADLAYYSFFAMFDIELSDAECSRLSTNMDPWFALMQEPDPIPVWTFASGGAGGGSIIPQFYHHRHHNRAA